MSVPAVQGKMLSGNVIPITFLGDLHDILLATHLVIVGQRVKQCTQHHSFELRLDNRNFWRQLTGFEMGTLKPNAQFGTHMLHIKSF